MVVGQCNKTIISLLDKLPRLTGKEKAFYSKILCAKEKYWDSPHGKF
jgi:hypothetical protein